MIEFRHSDRRDGFVLPVALLAIMVVGALVTGGFYASAQADGAGIRGDLESQASFVAEYGLNASLEAWRTTARDGMPGDTMLAPQEVMQGGEVLGRYTIHVRRLDTSRYLVSSKGVVAAGNRRAVGQVVSLVRFDQGCWVRVRDLTPSTAGQ